MRETHRPEPIAAADAARTVYFQKEAVVEQRIAEESSAQSDVEAKAEASHNAYVAYLECVAESGGEEAPAARLLLMAQRVFA